VKILLSSYVFAPSVGGIETVSALIAPEFIKAGHEVILITHTKEQDSIERPYEVIRRPGARRLIGLVRWCDVYFQNNISLTYAWPLLLIHRPWVIAHHTWIGQYQGERNFKARVKRILLRFGTNATISHPVAGDIPVPSIIVGNPYSAAVFKARPEIPRDRELAYLGRLVSDKGVDMIIKSMVQLRARGLNPRLTIIGSGSEEPELRRLVREFDLEGQVEFTGSKAPADIARLLNAHQVLVVPSRWPEPFGIVALEGLASGCVVVASAAGGLTAVVGRCGITFALGDQAELTDAIERVLTRPQLREQLRHGVEAHLRQFEPATVAGKYLAVFQRALKLNTP
jgi:glycosyltransferase involved in cell wall biosynthesis